MGLPTPKGGASGGCLVQEQDNTLFGKIVAVPVALMEVHVGIPACRIERSGSTPLIDCGSHNRLFIEQHAQNIAHALRGSGSGRAGGIDVHGGDFDFIGSTGGLPPVDGFIVPDLGQLIVIGDGQHFRDHAVHIIGQHIQLLPVFGSVLVKVHAGQILLIELAVLGHVVGKRHDVASKPAAEQGPHRFPADGGGGVGGVVGGVIFVYQVHHMTGSQDVLGGNEVIQCHPGHILPGIGHLIAHVGHDHAGELHELIRAGERDVDLIPEQGHVILPDVLTVVVQLQGLGLADLIHIRSVSIIPEVAGGLIVALIPLEFLVCQFQLSGVVPPFFAVGQQAPELFVIRPDGEDGPGEDLGNAIEQRIITAGQGSIGHTDEVRQGGGRNGVFAGGLIYDTLQELRRIIKTVGGPGQGVRHLILPPYFLMGGLMTSARISSTVLSGCGLPN